MTGLGIGSMPADGKNRPTQCLLDMFLTVKNQVLNQVIVTGALYDKELIGGRYPPVSRNQQVQTPCCCREESRRFVARALVGTGLAHSQRQNNTLLYMMLLGNKDALFSIDKRRLLRQVRKRTRYG